LPRIYALVVIACLLFATACASVQVTQNISESEAREALQAATLAGAKIKSPYEYYSAKLYFERALVEQDNGYLQTARRYFAKAHEQAMIAYNNAKKFRKAQ